MPNDFDAHRSTEPWSVDESTYRAGQFLTKKEDILLLSPNICSSRNLFIQSFIGGGFYDQKRNSCANREIDMQCVHFWSKKTIETIIPKERKQKVRAQNKSEVLHNACKVYRVAIYRVCIRVLSCIMAIVTTCIPRAPLRPRASLIFYIVCTVLCIRFTRFVRHRG